MTLIRTLCIVLVTSKKFTCTIKSFALSFKLNNTFTCKEIRCTHQAYPMFPTIFIRQNIPWNVQRMGFSWTVTLDNRMSD